MPTAEIVRLLADGDRLRTVAALVLGASSTEEVVAAAGIDHRAAVTALGRLADRGLVDRDDHGWRLAEEALRASARASAVAGAAAADDELGGLPAEEARVLRAFVKDRRLTSIPAQRSKRLVILDLLAQDFEPGRRYSEAMVNLILGHWHADTASLRRHLVDEELLARDRGQYWRIGGSVDPADASGSPEEADADDRGDEDVAPSG
jgi:hypothetical protein